MSKGSESCHFVSSIFVCKILPQRIQWQRSEERFPISIPGLYTHMCTHVYIRLTDTHKHTYAFGQAHTLEQAPYTHTHAKKKRKTNPQKF